MTTIPSLTAAGTATGDEALEVAQLSASVTITAATISAAAADNSYNDSGSGFVSAGFSVGDEVKVTGFTGDTANNIYKGTITALTAGKMTIGGTDGDVIVDDAAGESVTIAKWFSRRMTSQQVADLGGGATTGIYRANISATINNVTGDNTVYTIEWDNEITTATWCSMNTSTGYFTLDAGTYTIEVGVISTGGPNNSSGNASLILENGAGFTVQSGLAVRNTNDIRDSKTFALAIASSGTFFIQFQIEGASKTADLLNDPRTHINIVKHS